MNSMLRLRRQVSFGSFQSELFNNETFYAAFIRDLRACSREVIIESPFITLRRLRMLLPVFNQLADRGVRIVVNTRDPLEDGNAFWSRETETAIGLLQKTGVSVLYTSGHHRKLAIIDDCILWEGNLNILSRRDSCEIMRRIVSESEVTRMKKFIHLTPWLG